MFVCMDLQEEYKLREALDWFDHEAVQGDPVRAGSLLLLKVKT